MSIAPKLTIGIPTFNGACFLRDALDSIAVQLDDSIISQIEIMVSDNASTDRTGEVVKEFQRARGIVVRYFRNAENVGFDSNVDLLFKRATGDFVWTMGDDDVLEPCALARILALLDMHPQLKAIQVNFDKYNRQLEQVVDSSDMPTDQLYHDAETFLKHAQGRYGTLSALIINRNAWNCEDLSGGFGTLVIHMYGLVHVALRGDTYLVSDPLVKVRDGSVHANTTGNGDATIRILLTSGLLYHAMSKMGYSRELVRWYLRTDRPYVFSAIPRAKLWGIKNKIEVSKSLLAVHNSPSLWLRWLPLIFFPDFLFRPIYLLKKRISSKTRIIEKTLKQYLKRNS